MVGAAADEEGRLGGAAAGEGGGAAAGGAGGCSVPELPGAPAIAERVIVLIVEPGGWVESCVTPGW